jgi:hypothetical protein
MDVVREEEIISRSPPHLIITFTSPKSSGCALVTTSTEAPEHAAEAEE